MVHEAVGLVDLVLLSVVVSSADDEGTSTTAAPPSNNVIDSFTCPVRPLVTIPHYPNPTVPELTPAPPDTCVTSTTVPDSADPTTA